MGKYRPKPETVERLRERVMALAEAEFAEFWGEPWLAHGYERGRVSEWILARVDGELANAATEREARELYARLRRRRGSIATECVAWAERHPFGTGGTCAHMLRILPAKPPGAPMPSLSELDTRYPSMVHHDALAGVVRTLVEESERYPLADALEKRGRTSIPNRQLAAIAILLGVAPEGWVGYGRKLQTEAARQQGLALTLEERARDRSVPAHVLRDVETRVRKLIGPDRADLIRPR